MRIRQLVYMTIIASLISTNISYGYEVVKGNQNISKLTSEIDKMLKIKYTDPDETGDKSSNTNSVYQIIADDEVIESVSELKLKIERYIINQTVLDLKIIDKGHKLENGSTVGTELSSYERYETSQNLYQILNDAKDIKAIANIIFLDKNDLKTEDIKSIETVVITLINSNKIELKKDSDKLDFKKSIDKNGNYVDLSNIDINTSEGLTVAKAVVGFDKAKELDYKKEYDIPSKIVSDIKIIEDGFIDEINLNEYYDGYYSDKGKDLINILADRVFYKNGNKYNINYDLLSEGTDEEKCKKNITNILYKNDRYSFDIKLNVEKDVSLYLTNNQNFKLTIYSNNQSKLNQFRNDVIDAIVNENKNIENSEYYTLAGNDRFETSVEISKEYTKKNYANGVVLVGEDSVVDGLSVAPFAKSKNSPILLTKRDEIPNSTMNEIKRIFNKFNNIDTIYLVGGEDVISNKVYNKLVNEIKNIRIVRIDGEDRYKTSMNICSRIDISSLNKVYIVGGEGEADAMSIAPLATREGIPIIVSPKDRITKDIERFIEYNTNITEVEVIGGQNVVSTDVLIDIKNAAGRRTSNQTISIKRVWGNNRQETNAQVLKMFSEKKESTFIVAKDGMNNFTHLVDSMSAALLGYPIVLSTNIIINDQIRAVKNIIYDDHKLVQVGYGISKDVISRIISNL